MLSVLNSQTPRQIFGELFEQVQGSGIFLDSKTFVDAVPRCSPARILALFRQHRTGKDFQLLEFVREHFVLPPADYQPMVSAPGTAVASHISSLWPALTRQDPGPERDSSRIALPHPYLVPGGRFRELYYWDSYFTMLGLACSGQGQMMRHMVENFASLLGHLGHIPNSNRTYHLGRSQPPFFCLMVELLAEHEQNTHVSVEFLAAMRTEYSFWMAGEESVQATAQPVRRLVSLDKALLNRYWDDGDGPREESYSEDLLTRAQAGIRAGATAESLYREIRAACESGWDFSSRWLNDAQKLSTIHCTNVIPVDLNSLMYKMESMLADTSLAVGEEMDSRFYRERAEKRMAVIQDQFFDQEQGFFMDLNVSTGQPTGKLTLAGVYPLFLGIATTDQAIAIAERLRQAFLKPGGWVTALVDSGQQWDAPNGWAPLQWVVFSGLRRYGFEEDAKIGATRWLENVESSFAANQRLLEKYDVVQPGRIAGGGEYLVQDGFGWTNGTWLKLTQELAT